MFFSGCGGKNHKEIENCIPRLEYVSTENYEFIAYQLVNESKWRSYDVLRLSKRGEYALQIVSKGGQNIKDIAGDDIRIIRFDSGTKLVLTGKAIEQIPWGMQKSFSNKITYLQGEINGLAIWIASFYLTDLNKTNVDQNKVNNELIDLNSIKWNCPNK
jgi:hypothetical protein